MPKRVVNGLTVLSAAVCLLSLILVARSCFRADQAGFAAGRARLWFSAIDAQLIVAWDPSAVFPASFVVPALFDSYDAARLRPAFDTVWPRMTGIRALGIGWNLSAAMDERAILPLWLVPLLTAILPVRWWRARRRDAGRGFSVEGLSFRIDGQSPQAATAVRADPS